MLFLNDFIHIESLTSKPSSPLSLQAFLGESNRFKEPSDPFQDVFYQEGSSACGGAFYQLFSSPRAFKNLVQVQKITFTVIINLLMEHI